MHKFFTIGFILSVIFASLDLSERLPNLAFTNSEKSFNKLQLDSTLPILDEAGLEKIQSVLSNHRPAESEKEKDTPKDAWLDDDLQKLQNGKVGEFFLADERIRLKALIVTVKVKYALLEVTQRKNLNDSKLIKLVSGQEFRGYVSQISSRNVVSFSRAEQKVELVMYKSNNDDSKKLVP